jgi:hypothetical protein
MKRMLLIVPWCCVFTFLLPFLQIGSMGAGLVADELGHALLGMSFLAQLAITKVYVRKPHKERMKSASVVMGWLLLAAGACFHMSPLHDLFFAR